MALCVADGLQLARDLGVDRLDAQWLMAHLLRQPRTWLMAHDDHRLTPEQAATLRAQLQRRAAGVPFAYVLGETHFCGLALRVTPAVLVPRPETEMLVNWVLGCTLQAPHAAVLDLGTGSGAIALALKAQLQTLRPDIEVGASDASEAALEVARSNGERLGLAVNWRLGDWWAPWCGQRFAVVASNPPYVAGDDPHLAALAHEPRRALTPEGDGLADLHHIIDGAGPHLLPGGWLLMEHGHDQGAPIRERLAARGFVDIETRQDLAALDRCTGGRWPG